MVRPAVAVLAGLALSDTLTVKVDVPISVDVPEITPVVAFSERPFGRLPCAMVQE
jgi:hypothetical protein